MANQIPGSQKRLTNLTEKQKRVSGRTKQLTTDLAWNQYNDTAKIYKKSITEVKAKFFNIELVNILNNKPKKFWEVINPKTSKPVQLMSDDRLALSDEESAYSLNHYFISVFTTDDHSSMPHFYAYHTPIAAIEKTYSGIISSIERLQLSSSSGDDKINSKLLKKH